MRALSNRVSEKAFFKEIENKLVKISIYKKSVKTGRFKNVCFHQRVTREFQTFYSLNLMILVKYLLGNISDQEQPH